jgi:heptaprenyl diphosphate synthase
MSPKAIPTIGIPGIAPALEVELSIGMKEVETLLLSHIQGKYPLVEEASRHLVSAGGKRLRPLLTLLASHYGDKTKAGIIESAAVCELTHVATLYHDDVMDEAPLRRGVESANNRWGNTVAILTGDYLFAKVSALLADIGPEAVRLQAHTFERLVIGQIMETQGPAAGVDPLTHYLGVVADKTGSLISASARFGAMVSGAPDEIKETLSVFGEKIGITFQLADDVIDIASDSLESGKTPGTDLREGVPTLVTLNVITMNRPEDRGLIEHLRGPIKDEAIVAEVLATLRVHPALDLAREQMLQYARDARAALGPLPVNDVTGALYLLCDAIIDRSA